MESKSQKGRGDDNGWVLGACAVTVRWLGYLLVATIIITTCLLVASYMGDW